MNVLQDGLVISCRIQPVVNWVLIRLDLFVCRVGRWASGQCPSRDTYVTRFDDSQRAPALCDVWGLQLRDCWDQWYAGTIGRETTAENCRERDVVVREQRMQRQPETEGRFLADRLLGRSRGQRILAGSDQSFDLTRIFPRSKPRSNSVVAIFSASYLPRTGAITLRASPQHHNVDPTTLRSYKICRSVVEAVVVVVLVVIVVVDRYTLSRCLGLWRPIGTTTRN